MEARGHGGGGLALHGAHAGEIEGNAHGGPAELVHGDAGSGVEQCAAAGGGLGEGPGAGAGQGVCGGAGGKGQLPPAREADVGVEPPVEVAGDGGEDEAAVNAVAGGAQVVVVGVDEEQLGDDVAGTEEGAGHEHVGHEGSSGEEVVVAA